MCFLFFYTECVMHAGFQLQYLCANISQREANIPLAISFHRRAKVTWLTTLSHLTMHKDYQFAEPLVGKLLHHRSSSSAVQDEELLTPVNPSLDSFPHPHLITPAYKRSAMQLGSTPRTGLSPPPPTRSSPPSLLQHSTVGYWIHIDCFLSVVYA